MHPVFDHPDYEARGIHHLDLVGEDLKAFHFNEKDKQLLKE
ncbi:hypothetical protein [Oceanobacillus halotolerans]|nr:hypothetical protein [Oceanobacillus halotolerans]